jgi:uncharacterized protein (TIGR02596 family)
MTQPGAFPPRQARLGIKSRQRKQIFLVHDKAAGFTLIELIVVLAIAALLVGLAIPAISPTLRASKLTQAGALMSSQFGLARQTAIAKNKSVEVRICRYAVSGAPGEDPSSPSTGQFRAIRSFIQEDDGECTPVGPAQRLPTGVIVSNNISASPITALVVETATDTLPGNVPYQYTHFYFRADGSTDLDFNSQWFVTLKSATETAAFPSNFVTISVDPLNGNVQIYRP